MSLPRPTRTRCSPNALDDFRKEMADNGWDCGQDEEELFELAMHPEQYRNYKSGQAKKNFLADLQAAKDKEQGSTMSIEEATAFKHAKADAIVSPVKGQLFWDLGRRRGSSCHRTVHRQGV